MATRKLKKLPNNIEEIINDDEALKKVFERCDINAYSGSRNILFYDISDEMVKWCLEQGADINYHNGLDRTPLIYHASSCYTCELFKEEGLQHERMFYTLLKYGADIHVKTGYPRRSVFFTAVSNGNLKMINALLDAGADPNEEDQEGQTPLFEAADRGDPDIVRLLLDNGADPNHHEGKKDKNFTPLLYMLSFMEHGSGKPDIAEILIKACGGKEAISSEEWEKARAFVRNKGERLEKVRANYPDHSFEKSDDAMNKLYELFEVEPVKRIIKHDGVSPIIVDSTLPAGKIHDLLWDYLVPGNGSCKTVQGEVIRITGCVADEVYRNGGANWSRGYRKMVNNLPKYLSLGQPLSESELEEVDAISKPLPNQGMTEIERLEELAVKWVSMNSLPISLEDVS